MLSDVIAWLLGLAVLYTLAYGAIWACERAYIAVIEWLGL